MIWEIARFCLFAAVIFYAAINYGFDSSQDSQLNQAGWINVFFNYNLKNQNQFNSGSYVTHSPEIKLPLNSTIIENKSNSSQNQDSLSFKKDSLLLAKDTVKIDSMSIDSTARIKNFIINRVDEPYVKFGLGNQSPFFAQPSPGTVNRTITIDSTGKYVEIREGVQGHETKIVLRIPIDEYLKLSLAQNEQQSWDAVSNSYQYKSSKKELAQVIKDITNFDIPLPSVGILSIFGKPKISLRIGGAVDIHGAWVNQTTEGVTASNLGNTTNQPDFEQQVQINVDGTIGDKLNISADWNTQRTFEYQNQLKIKYTGYEDEIIQSIEAGNVSLETSPLVGGSEALFGVKANFKLGPLSLTTLASQKKGEIKTVAVNGGATSQTFTIRAYNYATNNYFVDTTYASTIPSLNLFYKYYGSSVPLIDGTKRIIDIQVWKSQNGGVYDPSKERQVVAYLNLNPLNYVGPNTSPSYPDAMRSDTVNPVQGSIETGRFVLLTPDVDYTLHPETGYITFNNQIQDQDVIAVAYRVENQPGPQDDSFYGEFLNSAASGDTSKPLVLKLIKPSYLKPNYTQAWKLLLKNIYPIGGTNIKQEGFVFNILYEVPGGNPVANLQTTSGKTVQLLNAFGLDNYDASGNANPDNLFDWRPGYDILPVQGEIIFPSLQPFGQNFPSSLPDSLAFQKVYDTLQTTQTDQVHDKWELTGKYSGESSSTYQLGFNVVENSVRVTLNGRELTPGVDYSMDYNVGQLTIRNDAALVPGANLSITYEQNDLFQLASKTLVGARGVFNFSDKTKLGFSVLNLNQQTLSDKVRIGEEPMSNTIMGVDFSTSADLPIVTKALDNIISTNTPSSISLNGEYAYMMPNPNTKISNIPDDHGQSVAYIDDFEGAKVLIPIGVSYTAWKDASPPDSLPLLSGLSNVDKMNYKSKTFWYSITPSDVNIHAIWGNRKYAAATDQQVPVMDFVNLPDSPGTYNYNPNLLQNRKKNWGGMMKVLSSTANNLQSQNIQYFEFWMYVDPKTSLSDSIYFDLGRISEAVIPDRTLHTEDINHNGILAQGADVGIDGMNDAQEQAFFHSTKADPSGDDFALNSNLPNNDIMKWYNVNGTEGNAVLTDIGRIPDTEDLNGNGNLDVINSYFRYAVPLDTSSKTNPYIAGGGDNAGWYLYRVPLIDTSKTVGQPTLSDVEYIRMFVTGVTNDQFHVRLAEFNLVGNQWQDQVQNDSTLSVSVVNVEDNIDYYSPPGVTRPIDPTQTNQTVYLNEQSLSLVASNLPAGDSRQAIKILYQPVDIFNYQEMKLFFHGDEHPNSFTDNISDTSNGGYTSEVYFKFGTDTSNYYEYRQPIKPGWNDADIIFKDLTAIKQSLDTTSNSTRLYINKVGDVSYAVKGQPSLTSIRFLMIGILNRTNQTNKPRFVSGTLWVDELRVLGADNHPGWAYSFGTSIKLADLMTVNFNMSQTDPYFHRLSDRFGSRVDTKNWSLSTNVDLLKLLPVHLPGSNLSLNYSHSETIGKPQYLPGTDININSAAQQQQRAINDTVNTHKVITLTPTQLISSTQSVSISDSWSASGVTLKIPSSSWLIMDTFNAITLGFNYNKTFSRSPTVISNKGWQWNANLNYGVNLSPNDFIYIAKVPFIGTILNFFTDYRDLKLYYAPQNISFSFSASRMRNVDINRPLDNTTAIPAYSRNFGTTRSFSTSWKLTDGGFLNLSANYSANINSSLAYLETDINNNQRTEGQIWKDIFSRAFFGKDYSYTQNLTVNTSPRLPSIWKIDQYLSLNSSYNVGYQWSNNFSQLDAGRSAGYTQRSTVGLTLRLKSLMEPLFGAETQQNVNNPNFQQNNERNLEEERRRNIAREIESKNPNQKGNDTSLTGANKSSFLKDSLAAKDSSLNKVKNKFQIKQVLGYAKTFIRILLFDYESISLNFNNSNSLSKSGILGSGTGLSNFFGLSFSDNSGPSRGFMLGLSGFVGQRVPNYTLQDAFTQSNDLSFSTSKPLWEGAKIDLNWRVGWSMNKSTSLQSDKYGNVSVQSISSSGTISRSFFTLPPVLFLSVFKSGIKRVSQLYNQNDPNQAQNLSNAFVQGFESLPIFSNVSFLKNFADYIPRPNWSISWDGLEKIYPFKTFAQRVSLNHSYSSTYSEGWYISPDGTRITQSQRIDYGFAPLIGINFTFLPVWQGNFTGSIKYSTNSTYDLGVSTANITQSFSRDIGVTAGYSKSGFELPIFGISLKNDIEFSFSYTNSQTSTVLFNMNNYTDSGTPQNGNVRVSIEPQVKYTISSKVTISIFYTRTSVTPAGSSSIPPSTSNTAGLDVHISIQ